MSLCETCQIRDGCSFAAAVQLARIQWAETGRAVFADVTRCSVADDLARMGPQMSLISVGCRVRFTLQGQQYTGVVVSPPSEESLGYLEVNLDVPSANGTTLMPHYLQDNVQRIP